MFFKKSRDPTAKRIIKTKRQVGTSICTTGREYRGPAGGLWVEVDPERNPNEEGWTLVSGPGFGIVGPLLVDPEILDERHVTIKVRWLKDPHIFECVMPVSATIGHLVNVFSVRTGLNPKEVIFTKGLPGKSPRGEPLPLDYTPTKDVLHNHMTIQEANICDTLNLIYLGHFDEDYRPMD